jgi:thiamine-monophosphate kinase
MMSSNSEARRLGEFQRIAKFFAPLSYNAKGALGLADDAALVRVEAGHELVVTVDALVEGVHFFPTDPPGAIAQKGLRVNLSDLAGKGARPEGYLLAISLPDWVDDAWLAQFADGLSEDQMRFAIPLIGGDTTGTPGPLSLAITALGSVVEGRMLRRSGARPGDVVFVSGTIGDAGLGLAILAGKQATPASSDCDFLVGRYRLPEPRLALGQALVGLATAALDVSDGLVADLGHIGETALVRIAIEASRLPLSGAYRRLRGANTSAIAAAATSGDDYEIAFTAPASARDAVRAAAGQTGTPVAEIGRVEEGRGAILLDGGGRQVPLSKSGFTHF